MSDPRTAARPDGHADPAALAGQVRRTTLLLAGALTLSWTIIQLQSSLTAVTLKELAGTAVAGLGSTVFLGASALSSVLVGRLMDRRGRRIGLALGFAIAVVGTALSAAGTSGRSAPLFLLGIALVGAAVGAVGLARVAAADLHPAESRGRGISLVLMGSAAGAIVGPILYGPFLAGVHDDLDLMATPWLIGVGLALLGLLAIAAIRIEPMELGRRLGLARGRVTEAGERLAERDRPFREVLANPTIRVTVATVVVAQAAMAMSMAVVGLLMVDHGHDLAAVSVTYSAHFLGMYGLVLVVGPLVDRIGHRRSLVVGLLVELVGALGLAFAGDQALTMLAIFLVGLGWNVAFVASTTLLADATDAGERARVIGVADAIATSMAAGGSLAATEVLALAGLTPLIGGLAILVLLPLPLLALERRQSVRRPVTSW